MSKLSDDLLTYIDTISRRYGIDPNLTYAVIKTESSFNPKARSRKGAKGLMQLSPLIIKAYNVVDPYDPHQNIEAGVRYLSNLISTYDDQTRALAHYAGGRKAGLRPQRVGRYLSRIASYMTHSPFPLLPPETRYVERWDETKRLKK